MRRPSKFKWVGGGGAEAKRLKNKSTTCKWHFASTDTSTQRLARSKSYYLLLVPLFRFALLCSARLLAQKKFLFVLFLLSLIHHLQAFIFLNRFFAFFQRDFSFVLAHLISPLVCALLMMFLQNWKLVWKFSSGTALKFLSLRFIVTQLSACWICFVVVARFDCFYSI